MASSHNNGHIAEESPQVLYRNDWRTSDAKKTLRAMVADGRVTEATNADTVYDETDPAFKFYDRKKFKTNLRNLLKSVSKAASQTTPNHKKTGQADNKTKEPVYLQDWRYSKAKQVLKRLIEDGTVSAAMPAIDVYNKYPVLFARYKKENFEKNYEKLLESVAADVNAVKLDEDALKNDRLVQGSEPEVNSLGYPRWYGTPHQQHLKEIVEGGLHKDLDWDELLTLNLKWKDYPLDVFKRHLRQEENRFIGRSYWMNRSKKKLKKKKEIEELLESLNI
jgi:cell fate (sporulation/competence/biofilm development) regulator YmcA (YheA/YmcA/DUF963 family)